MAHLDRVIARLREGDPFEALAGMPASDLRTLLLHVFRRRAPARPLRALLAQAGRAAVLAPCSLDARALHALAGHAWAVIPDDYRGLEIAPVVPPVLRTPRICPDL